ncbi:PKD domain-containing protein [Winogradskyella undariae]|uniref:PKD domain-containing protein n=1 Tax=Winogradskyella undariae TaxID=1285465 RepID=UPI00156BA6AE|nr:PKD domain-containing protein [Winogradskyella undariae]NRR92107.1 PKD domain-containing protein [Winogradskyella undariae]
MKNINRLNKYISHKLMAVSLLVTCASLVACDPSIDSLAFDLPDANSQEDLTPPTAVFSASVNEDNYLTYTFANESTNATSYFWDYGDGNTFTDDDGADGTNTYPAEGTYTITLTATDNLGVLSTYSEQIEVIEPEIPTTLVPEILEAGFDNGDSGDAPVEIDSRDPWRNSDLGGVLQITSSNNYHEGSYGAKLPKEGDRVGYQLIGEFTPNKFYKLSFKYAFRDQIDTENGSISVAMVQPMESIDELEANTVGIITYTEDVAGVGTMVSGELTFNSGGNTSLAIFFFNDADEAYIDSFEIEALE